MCLFLIKKVQFHRVSQRALNWFALERHSIASASFARGGNRLVTVQFLALALSLYFRYFCIYIRRCIEVCCRAHLCPPHTGTGHARGKCTHPLPQILHREHFPLQLLPCLYLPPFKRHFTSRESGGSRPPPPHLSRYLAAYFSSVWSRFGKVFSLLRAVFCCFWKMKLMAAQ